MKEPKPVLTPAELKLLQTRDFSQNPPGTILRDFDALLDFIGTGRVPP